MMRRLPRAAAACLLLACLLLVAGIGATAVMSDRTTAKRERNAKLELSRILGARRPAAARPASAFTAPDILVASESETLAAADLDALIRENVRNAGGSTLSSRAEIKHDSKSDVRRIEAQVVFDGRIEAIQAIFYRLETGVPLVFIDELSVQQRQAVAAGSDLEAPLLHVSATLSAFWKTPPP